MRMTKLQQIRSVIEKVTNVRRKNCLPGLHSPHTLTDNTLISSCLWPVALLHELTQHQQDGDVKNNPMPAPSLPAHQEQEQK